MTKTYRAGKSANNPIRFKYHSECAAGYECQANYFDAATQWELAYRFARPGVNKQWSKSRELFCLRMHKRPF